jgi:hypothetical protein
MENPEFIGAVRVESQSRNRVWKKPERVLEFSSFACGSSFRLLRNVGDC